MALSDDRPNETTAFDAIAVVDVERRWVVARLPGGSDPKAFGVTPDDRFLYAANEDAGTSVVRLGGGRPVATFLVGTEPEGVGVSPDGRFVVVTAESGNRVSIISTRTE